MSVPSSTHPPLIHGASVGVIDDDPEGVAEASQFVRKAGFRPVEIQLRHNMSISDVLEVVEESCDGAICDHRLRARAAVNFDGAEVCSAINDQLHIPTILRTTFASEDSDTTIRRWRHHIPCVLDKLRREDQPSLNEAFEQTVKELSGSWAHERQPCSAAIYVANIRSPSKSLDVVVGAWRSGKVVSVPAAIVAETLDLTEIKKGSWLSAIVNCHAVHERDLYFHGFKKMGELSLDWMRR